MATAVLRMRSGELSMSLGLGSASVLNTRGNTNHEGSVNTGVVDVEKGNSPQDSKLTCDAVWITGG